MDRLQRKLYISDRYMGSLYEKKAVERPRCMVVDMVFLK